MIRVVHVLTALVAVAMLVGCAASTTDADREKPPAPSVTETPGDQPAPDGEDAASEAATLAWADTELSDPVTGSSFRISDFKGKPVLLHAFAVW